MNPRFSFSLLAAVSAFGLSSQPLSACDLCGCTVPGAEIRTADRSRFYAGVSEQFTRYGTLQQDAREIADPAGQFLQSSTTQIYAGWQINDRFGLQINLPFIHRSFRRVEGDAIERGSVSGLGDISLVGHWTALRSEGVPASAPSSGKKAVVLAPAAGISYTLDFFAGVKLPTGSTSRLREETMEVEPVEGATPSGVHGHDLTLGTGSVDVFFGANGSIRSGRFFATAEVQYIVRTRGAFGYRFANDLSASGGPGFDLYSAPTGRLGLQLLVSGETKPRDYFRGGRAEDTGVTTIYVGPRLTARLGSKVDAILGASFPVLRDNTAVQTVADYRIQAALNVRF